MRYGFKAGDKLKCIAARDERLITLGSIYTAAKDEEEGIFSDRPYITIDLGLKRTLTCHASRFEKVQDDNTNI